MDPGMISGFVSAIIEAGESIAFITTLFDYTTWFNL